jgi:hypothetical protein
MSYEPKHLKLWTMPDNYAGEVWPNTYSSGFGQSRDSDVLERANFEEAWSRISEVAENAQVVRENHWAVGWVEWIAINADDDKALRVADALRARYEQYPILNEDQFSEVERQEADRTWAYCYSVSERIDYIRKHRSQFEFHDLADMLNCVRGKFFSGYAGELVSR